VDYYSRVPTKRLEGSSLFVHSQDLVYLHYGIVYQYCTALKFPVGLVVFFLRKEDVVREPIQSIAELVVEYVAFYLECLETTKGSSCRRIKPVLLLPHLSSVGGEGQLPPSQSRCQSLRHCILQGNCNREIVVFHKIEVWIV
jgi:hypothetical protein